MNQIKFFLNYSSFGIVCYPLELNCLNKYYLISIIAQTLLLYKVHDQQFYIYYEYTRLYTWPKM